MKRVEPKLIAWLRLSIATFLGLVAINLGLPALLLLLQIPSFVIGGDELWLLQWQNDKLALTFSSIFSLYASLRSPLAS
jgi:NhaP-type Na+/H+ and K+/H+ antiporter